MLPTEPYFLSHGLEPLAWNEALRRAEARLGVGDASGFARLHRAFIAYPTEHTARAFYDFVARHDLHGLLACHRFARLVAIAEALAADVPPGARVLDVGAGGGYLAAYLQDVRGAVVSAADLSPATEERLAALGFPPPAPGDRFDCILCADSLGEIHADEDGWLADPAHADDPAFADELEARYGLAHKLAALAPRLASGGVILLFEPVALEHFWAGAARRLESAGWTASLAGPEPAWRLRLTVKP